MSRFLRVEYAEAVLHVPKAYLIPSYDRAHGFYGTNYDQARISTPFYFWQNDDNDSGDVDGSDIPGGGGNGSDGQVNGARDLVDFFAVKVDLSAVDWPTDDIACYLKHTDGAVNMIEMLELEQATYCSMYWNGRWSHWWSSSYLPADAYLKSTNIAMNYATREVRHVTAGGITLSDAFVNAMFSSPTSCYNKSGNVVLLEARPGQATTGALILEVRSKSNGTVVCTGYLPLHLDSVEHMYRWINLRPGHENESRTGEPANYPDSLCTNKQMVFIHGFNVSVQEARGSIAEFFKRLYQSGSRAMFTGVTWEGDETPGILPAGAYYHADVINAFQAASNFAATVSQLPGQKYVAAHSLGNMVVSSAIKDYGLNPSNYFMIDAAVAMEAYKSSERQPNEIAESPWLNYTNRLWASDWYSLFDGADGRNKLTWRGRFGNIPQAINYYSSGEDVLNNNDPPENMYIPHTEKAWVFQEKVKGGILPAILIGVDSHGGWGLNHDYDVQVGTDELGNPIYGAMPPDQAALLTEGQIQTNSFFKRFYLDDLYEANGSAVATNAEVCAKVLAEAVPATSRATGRNAVDDRFNGNNIDMMSKKNGWPQGRLNDDEAGPWQHSDFRKIAYLYVYPLYDDFIIKGGLR